MKKISSSALFWLAVFLLSLDLALPSAAQTGTVLHTFLAPATPNDGVSPQANLIQGTDGNFYGTTYSGGSVTYGTIFRVTPTGAVSILHSFFDGTTANDGAHPSAGLIQGTNGNFYGTTYDGGSAGHGTVFQMTPSGTVTVLHSFGDGTVAGDGAYPTAGLVQGKDGNFYGTTSQYGTHFAGVLFKVTPTGAETILFQFGGPIVNNSAPPAVPLGGLILATDGNFYGTTSQGGGSTGMTSGGTIYRLTPAGTVTTLHSFSASANGEYPEGTLAQVGDSLYGTCMFQGAFNQGTVFKMSMTGALTVVHSFGDSAVAHDGAYPVAGLLLASDGNLYGTTPLGGVGQGTLFRLTPAGAETILHIFGDGTVAHDGTDPVAALIQGRDGNVYGTASTGGYPTDSLSFYQFTHGGTIFKFSPAAGYSTFYGFQEPGNVNDSSRPLASRLVLGKDGNFYGSTQSGGTANQGTLYRSTPAGVITTLHNFGDGSVPNDGEGPVGNLCVANDGNLYGTTYVGGAAGQGCVFKFTPTGTLSLLYSFSNGTLTGNAVYPRAGVIQGSDGNFYGTASGGISDGIGGQGTVFEVTPTGEETVLYQFNEIGNNNEGVFPAGGLVEGKDHAFYGMTEEGGSQNQGVIYRVTTAGTETILHEFDSDPDSFRYDGAVPIGDLILGTDGNFYGSTASGGYDAGDIDPGSGAIIRMTPSGTATVVGGTPDGVVSAPYQGTDGNLYYACGGGVLEGMTLDGFVADLYGFTLGLTSGGEYDPAEAAPIQDNTGAFYGTFSSGGAGKAGILYKVEKLAQSIIVPSIPPKHVGTTIVQGLTATSGLPVSYQVISGPGVLTPQGLKLTATGTVVVKATQPGSLTYAAAPPATVNIQVVP